MARGFSLLLTALVSAAVAVHGLQTCGSAQYDPSQYTCFNNSQLCPIVNGDAYQSCGPNQCYSKKQYTCFNGNFLCPVTSGGIATQACGNACYSPYQYSCNANNQLVPVPPCIAGGVNEVCNTQGCFQLPCCKGYISIADHCRDPCEVVPSSCPNGTNPLL
ncbi:hypothetical protein MSAN_00265500 [Mycena sanguinolenta]|uniref:Endo-1,3(4)-beta-glucanase 1 carbohydrate binding domain-containing protein n=1 Tax=Mycena sanguinolenta TaxID=230812 RepID=A0A8H6ZG80_9AGAR|nr:hypothetical protein MSAN_00265500 [Mycena sanguinolenta]